MAGFAAQLPFANKSEMKRMVESISTERRHGTCNDEQRLDDCSMIVDRWVDVHHMLLTIITEKTILNI